MTKNPLCVKRVLILWWEPPGCGAVRSCCCPGIDNNSLWMFALACHQQRNHQNQPSQSQTTPSQCQSQCQDNPKQPNSRIGVVWLLRVGCHEAVCPDRDDTPSWSWYSIGRDRRSPRRWYCSQSCQAKAEPRWRTGAEDGTGADRSGPWGPCKGENKKKTIENRCMVPKVRLQATENH